MRAIELQTANGIDNLTLVTRPVIQPGPGQVLVRMSAASLNYRDYATVTLGQMPLPLVPCSDGCGFIEAVGSGVRRVQLGDRVAPLFFQGWLSGAPRPELLGTALGGPIDGTLQEYMLLSEQGVIRVPEHLTDLEVSTLPCAGLTAWRALVVEGGLKAGDTVLVQGTGGVSILALQFAKAHGAEVIVTSSSDAKLERARALGADHLINYAREPQWSSAVLSATHGRGVDHVIEVGGANTLAESLKSVRLGGHIALIGVLSGYVQSLSIPEMFRTNARIQGVTVGNRDQFEDMCRALARNQIHPVVDRKFPLAEAREAFRLMESGSHFGKIVVDVNA
ncbi:MAG: zinc-dependent alcohol dehydrogenase family protein [Pseudomonadales bacterium]